jgi:hypothetical protein
MSLRRHPTNKEYPEEEPRRRPAHMLHTSSKQALLQRPNHSLHERESLEMPYPQVKINKQRQTQRLIEIIFRRVSNGNELVPEQQKQVVICGCDNQGLDARNLMILHQPLEDLQEILHAWIKLAVPRGFED